MHELIETLYGDMFEIPKKAIDVGWINQCATNPMDYSEIFDR